MKKVLIVLIVLVVLIVAVFVGAMVYVNTKGKDIVAGILKEQYKTEVKIDSLTLSFPSVIHIKGFSCGDVAFKQVDVFVSGYNSGTKEISLASLDIEGLDLKVNLASDSVSVDPFFIQKFQAPEQKKTAIRHDSWFLPEALAADNSQTASPIKIGILNIKNSMITLIDRRSKPEVEIFIKDITGKIRGLQSPDLPRFDLDLKASLEVSGVKMKDSAVILGWIDYPKKALAVSADFSGLCYTAFSAYCPQGWQALDIGIKEAVLLATTKLNSQNNDLVISGAIIVDKVDYADDIENNPRGKTLRTTINYFKKDKDKPEFPFKYQTKMDAPVFGPDFLKTAFGDVLNQAPGLLVEQVLQNVKIGQDGKVEFNSADMEKTIDSVKDMFKGFKKDQESSQGNP